MSTYRITTPKGQRIVDVPSAGHARELVEADLDKKKRGWTRTWRLGHDGTWRLDVCRPNGKRFAQHHVTRVAVIPRRTADGYDGSTLTERIYEMENGGL